MPQRPQVFQNIGRRHNICLKIKIFAERYPFLLMTPATNVKIAFLADFENDWKEKYMDQKAGSIGVARWTSMRLSLQEFSKSFLFFKCE